MAEAGAAPIQADYVLDASALAKTFLDEPESPAFRAWYRERIGEGARLAAPDLLGYEIAHLMARNVGARGPFRSRVRQAVEGIQLHPAFDAVGPYVDGLTAYDASYLATAAASGAVLVTYDRALVRAGKVHRVPVISP